MLEVNSHLQRIKESLENLEVLRGYLDFDQKTGTTG